MNADRAWGHGGDTVRERFDALLPQCVALGVFILLAAFATAEPAVGVTWSGSPFTDEGFSLLNSRNFAVLGQWSVDEWNLHLISVPYAVIHAAVFIVAGPGIVQARLVEIAATAATVGLIVLGLRRTGAPWPAAIGGMAFGTCALVLYYGRLAILEPLVALGLTAAAVFLATGGDRQPVRAGVVAGLGLALAIGTKPLAIPSAIGLLLATLLVSWRRPPARWRLLSAVATLGCAAAAWVVFVGLPYGAEVAAHIARLPSQDLPTGIGAAYRHVLEYVGDNDGVLELAAPLLIGGALGCLFALVRWSRLAPSSQSLLIIALGWFVASFGLLTLVPYAPSRYVVPSLPPLALMIGVGSHALFSWLPPSRWLRPVLIAAIVVPLAVPGLWRYAQWTADAPTSLPTIQAQYAEEVPAGAAVAGNFAPLLAMRTTGPTLFSLFGINQGDLYGVRRVRWVVVEQGEVPSWAALHPVAWAERRLVQTTAWGEDRVDLYRLP